LPGRAWQEITCADGGDWTIGVELRRALEAQPRQPLLHHALGHVTLAAQNGQGPLTSAHVEGTMEHFRRALACDPLHATAALSLVEALRIGEYHQPATDGARQVLAQLEQGARLSPAALDLMPLTLGFSTLRVEWERCAWECSGNLTAEAQAKRQLLLWHTHTVLGELTGDPRHFEQAALARPDLPSAQALLGLSLSRARRPRPAIDCLRRALGDNPFDARSARLLFNLLHQTGEPVAARCLARERRLLAEAADGLLRQEPWFH
jgi:tetratricopeptide (TPR) repeat protein